MGEIKYTYFDLRVKGEPARLLLAYGGVRYTDERVELGWNNPKPWQEMKPGTPWGQLPMLRWKGDTLCQSMAICRFLAREFGVAGRTSMEQAQVDGSYLCDHAWPVGGTAGGKGRPVHGGEQLDP